MDDRTLVLRVERLERECRRWRAGGLAALGLAALVGLAAARPRPPEVLRAAGLEIVDADGNGRVVIEASKTLMGLALLGPGEGQPRFVLGLSPDGSGRLHFSAKDGGPAAMFGVGGDGRPTLLLRGEGKSRVGMTITGRGPSVSLKDAAGEEVFRAPSAD